MVRAPCCEKMGLKKGLWTPEEDRILISFIQRHGHGNWRALPQQAGLLRCGKSCRLRWINYLRPDVKRGNFSDEEEETIVKLHQIIGNRWSAIAARLPGRTDNEIKNYWHSHLKKRLKQNSITTGQESDDQTLLLQRDINNATQISKSVENLIPTHQRIQNPKGTTNFRPQSRLEFAGSIRNEGADASRNSTPGIEGKTETRDFATKETMNYDNSNNVMEFWYNILMEAAGNSIEMQRSLEQFG